MKNIEQLELLAQQGFVFPLDFEHPIEIISLWDEKLRKAFGSEVVDCTRAIYGDRAHIDDLTKVARQGERVLARRSEQASMLPFLRDFLAVNDCPSDFAKVRQWMGRRGLSNLAWRALTKLEGRDNRDLMISNLSSGGPFTLWLNLLANATQGDLSSFISLFSEGRPRGYSHFEHMLQGEMRKDAVEQLTRLFGIAHKELRAKAPQSKQAVLDELECLGADLYPEILAGVQVVFKNSTLSSLRLRLQESEARLKALAIAQSAEAQKVVFPVPSISELTLGSIEWKFLPDVPALISEGVEMQHCVKDETYWRQCATGNTLIFHAQHPERPSLCATASFVRFGGAFVVSQVKGKANSTPPAFLVEQARNLVEMLNR